MYSLLCIPGYQKFPEVNFPSEKHTLLLQNCIIGGSNIPFLERDNCTIFVISCYFYVQVGMYDMLVTEDTYELV